MVVVILRIRGSGISPVGVEDFGIELEWFETVDGLITELGIELGIELEIVDITTLEL